MQDFSNLVEEVENILIPYFKKIEKRALFNQEKVLNACLLYTSPSPRD